MTQETERSMETESRDRAEPAREPQPERQPAADTRMQEERTAPPEERTAAPVRSEGPSEMSEYRTRFDEIQAQFIDEPRGAVHSAQTLVEEAIDRMMQGLRQSGADGHADTEQLRMAMKRYRDLIYQLTEPG